MAFLLFGGPILYLLTQTWWYYVPIGRAWSARFLAVLACAAGVAAVWLPPLASVLILDAVLIALVLVLGECTGGCSPR